MKRNLSYSALLLLLALLLTVTGTFAWLSKEQKASGIYAVLSDFEVQGTLTLGGEVYTGAEVMVPVSLDPADPNYIGTMRYAVQYTGASPACVRVRILEQWLDPLTDDILPARFLDYAVTASAVTVNPPASPQDALPAAGSNPNTDPLAEPGQWVDNRAQDYCYYFSVPVQPKTLAAPGGAAVGDGSIALTLLDQTLPDADTGGMLAGIDPDTVRLTLRIEVEAVQPNRFREFWNIDALPYSPAT